MLKLYGSAWSRAAIVKWYLEELGTPYEFVLVDLQAGEQLKPEFLAINPMGRVPAIADGELTLWESGAILLYLADQYGGGFATPAERAQANQWIVFANATLGVELFSVEQREKATPRLLQPLDDWFTQHPFVMGEQFSVADVAIGSTLSYVHMMLKPDWTAYPAVLDYGQRLNARPAFQKAMAASP
jgi:glutathione S-transferase